MKHTVNETIIDLLATSECNLLLSLKELRPDDLYRQAMPEFNHIGWIFGHCAVHLHWVLDLMKKGTRTFSEKVCHYYRYGTTKEEILDGGPPITFSDLVDGYLDVSEAFFEFLRGLQDDELYVDFLGEPGEDLLQTVFRVSLHFMGHTGQIVLIRLALGNPGPSFVSGVTRRAREGIMNGWHAWWKNNSEQFSV